MRIRPEVATGGHGHAANTPPSSVRAAMDGCPIDAENDPLVVDSGSRLMNEPGAGKQGCCSSAGRREVRAGRRQPPGRPMAIGVPTSIICTNRLLSWIKSVDGMRHRQRNSVVATEYRCQTTEFRSRAGAPARAAGEIAQNPCSPTTEAYSLVGGVGWFNLLNRHIIYSPSVTPPRMSRVIIEQLLTSGMSFARRKVPHCERLTPPVHSRRSAGAHSSPSATSIPDDLREWASGEAAMK